MMATTYQHDYIPPLSKRYDFLQKQLNKDHGGRQREECQCGGDQPPVEVPKAALEKCAAGAVEWTNIAPMGRLVEPRLIPTKFTAEQNAAMAKDARADCGREQPNRFLKLLRTLYPDLYERLKQMPKDEMNRRLERQRLFTTYQIDFCNMNEYPEGVYDSLKQEEETSKLNARKLLEQQGPCAEFRTHIMQELERESGDGGGAADKRQDPCEKAYKPFKITFADSARFIASGNNSHWRANVFAKRANFSEYMDTINKNGCVIMKNRIHDHSKCLTGKHCRHQLVHVCTNLK